MQHNIYCSWGEEDPKDGRKRRTTPEEFYYSRNNHHYRDSPDLHYYHGHRQRETHDHIKRQYRTRTEAEEVIREMRRRGKDNAGTLNAYYNSDYGRWFVGNSRY